MALFGAGRSGQGKCEVAVGGYRHQCRLDDITPTGAEVSCTGFLGETRHGEACVLHLQDNARQIDCRVTEIAAGRLQLRFGSGGPGRR